jgi:subtilisin family serine protease
MPSIRLVSALALILACAPARKEPEPTAPKPNVAADRASHAPLAQPPAAPAEDAVQRIAPPEAAYAHGWMSLASTGVDRFLRAHPSYDGRGVLIAILDTGIDPSVPGLSTTSTGDAKILELRDFSHEGAVPLRLVAPTGDTVEIAGRRLVGFGRVKALNTAGPYFAGTIAEIPLGQPPSSDLNANGTVGDTLPLLVTRASDGWVLFADTDGDGSLAGERPIHDYLSARESFGWAARGHTPKLAIAANLSDSAGTPRLDLLFDTFGHGTHVSGIAAAHDLYGVTGFDGVAPGAQLLGLKIARGAQGGITTTGSILRAVDYAIRFAAARRLPLVINLSFGVGNEIEGEARIDHLIDSILTVHPDVVCTISAGNDGPGLSTLGFPGSATLAISVGATLPSSFLPSGPSGERPADLLAYFSSRGGELAKPDIVTPGVAYSSVPRWNAGDEVEQGTSMAAPHAAGLAALLVSALIQQKQPVDARVIKQALMVTARPIGKATFVDQGTGLPAIESALQWLESPRSVPQVEVRVPRRTGPTTGALERAEARSDTSQTFELVRPADAPPATYTLRSDAAWLTAPARVTLHGPLTRVTVAYTRKSLVSPGAYVGTISGWSEDTLAGPAFRLVNTIEVPAPVADGRTELRSATRLPPGSTLRTFFEVDSARPFVLTVSTGELGQKTLAFLHEPDGMPYRDQASRAAGNGAQAAEYQSDSRDVLRGAYEAVLVAPPNQTVTASLSLLQSPVTLSSVTHPDGVTASIRNVSAEPVTAEVGVHVGGAERQVQIQARNSDPQRIPFVAPPAVNGVVVDVMMDRAQWGRFTDFGLSLFDSAGRLLGKQPLNYAFGRLQVELPANHGEMPLSVGLFPGFADSTGDQSWSAELSIRLYGDSATAVAPVAGSSPTLTIAPGKSGSVSFPQPVIPWRLSEGFFPLGVLVARIDRQVWTRETGFIPSDEAASK